MVNATHMIVLLVPRGAALEVDRVADVARAAGAEILETRTVPVPVTLSDRRTVHNLLVNSADAKGLSSRLRDLSDEHGVDIAPRAPSKSLTVASMGCVICSALRANSPIPEPPALSA